MPLARSAHVCQSCGYRSTKWLGRCPECGSWSSFSEELEPVGGSASRVVAGREATLVALAEIEGDACERTSSGLPVVDRVLGGGVVAGAAVLVAGEPGIGKSTLLLQLSEALAARGSTAIYVSAEESPRQLRLRAERLGALSSQLLVAGETDVDAIVAATLRARPAALIVDSVQAIRAAELESPPGSIGQVRLCAHRLIEATKPIGTALFLVGHVTKEGTIAGPKALEHLVDTVLSFEGERESGYRILRATKNRFGATGELALFEMRDRGLEPVPDPSAVLLARRRSGTPGSAVLPTLSGTRPLLVETQALIHPTNFPSPRRMSVGLDPNRVVLLVAVLERFGGLALADRDLFLNMVGGLAIREPAADLAVAAAVVSAYRGVALPADAVFFGEVGLLGEVRPVAGTEPRLREAASHGFRRAFLPRTEGIERRHDLVCVEIASLDELGERVGLSA